MSLVVQWLFCLALIVWFYWLWTRRKFYALIFKIPGPLGYPILGVAPQLMYREEMFNTLHKYTEKYGSMYFSWIGPYPFLGVSEPDIIQDILTSPHCVNKSRIYKAVDEVIGKGVIGLEDPNWSIHRKYLNSAFGHKVLLGFIPTFNKEVNDLLKIFQDMTNSNDPIDLTTILQDLALNIATKTTMGKSATEDARESNRDLLRSYHCIVENTAEIVFAPWLGNDLLRKLLGIDKPYKRAKREIRQFIRKLIDEKLTNGNSSPQSDGSKNIFIDQAIDLMRRGIFTSQDVEDESNTIVVAAFETTANTIAYVLIMLAMFPEYQQKVFEELLSIFPGGGDFEVTYDNIQDMVYMDMVLNETMRLMPPVPLVARQNSQDVLLSNGVVLPEGLQLGIDIFRLHRRVDIWGPEAHLFNPDNFLPSNTHGKHPYAFIPFTKGIRSCIGWRYGSILAKAALSKLLRNFRLSTDFHYKDLQFMESIVLKLKQLPLLRIHKREL